eukprot:TRINITY_DN24887_c0_g1_i1.p1 TRINITY_DN24887_c0_g1~~TRINITY_DN24887_c0_g1_i1.p1  ORF type:complete len:745 (+),score=116.21 TRINITY_DN24887_c0_g1_i1:182-2416(+)
MGADEDTVPVSVFGPRPLVRHTEDGGFALQPEGLSLLRTACAPMHVVFAIGGSRCGKSTASNALLFGTVVADESSVSRFETGNTFEPVTAGIDVAVRPLPCGGSLVVADCEGAFHIAGSSQSARGFGPLGLLAYHVCSAVLHVSMGSIDERDIEALGFLAASAECATARVAGAVEDSVAAHGGGSCADVRSADSGQSRDHRFQAPSLVLLVNGARFDLGDSVARRLLRPPEGGNSSGEGGGRRSARAAIARGFLGSPALEALPPCEHQAYWLKVDVLRRRLLETPSCRLPNGSEASGEHVVSWLQSLTVALNSEANVAQSLCEPEPATEMVYRSAHFEPLIEEISRKFAAAGTAGESRDHPTSSVYSTDEALAEFDRRARSLHAPTGGLREGLVAEMRSRLSARLSGISEALARGRQQAAARMMPRTISIPPRTPEKSSTENSSHPGTPRKGKLCEMEVSIEEIAGQLRSHQNWAHRELAELKAAASEHERKYYAHVEWKADAEKQGAVNMKRLEDTFRDKLRDETSERTRVHGALGSASSSALSKLQVDVHGLAKLMPDQSRCAKRFEVVRESLEAGRVHRQEVVNAATQTIDVRLQALRAEVEREAGALAALCEVTKGRVERDLDDLRCSLEEERSERRDRYSALSEIVDRLRVSLESTAEASWSRVSMADKPAVEKGASLHSNVDASRRSGNSGRPAGAAGVTRGRKQSRPVLSAGHPPIPPLRDCASHFADEELEATDGN